MGRNLALLMVARGGSVIVLGRYQQAANDAVGIIGANALAVL
tara:strand:+ start:2126 stop:2251 length:126 start_codon:yes stop_codon:yes gene_type:complete